MEVSNKTRIKISWAYNFFALIGLLVQVVIISIELFAFNVSRDVEFVIPKKLAIPDMTVCVKIWDLMAGSERKVMTVTQALNHTVKEEDFVRVQLVRKGSNYCKVVNRVPDHDCNGTTIVTKWLMSDNVCYTLTYNFTHGNYLTRATLSNTNYLTDILKNSFYSLVLAVPFGRLKSFTPVIHTPKSNPVSSYDSSEYYRREVEGNGRSSFVHNMYQVSYKSYELYLLPFPYKTDCRRYKKSQSECKEDCTLKHYLTKTSEYPEHVFISDMSLVGDRNLTTGLNTGVKQRIKSCSYKCRRADCVLKYSTSSVKGVGLDGDALFLTLVSPLDPYVVVKAKPSFPTFEYILYIASCLGIWFGISFLSLNPVPVQKINDRVASVCPNLEAKAQNKATEDMRILRRQNSLLFMKVQSLEATVNDLLDLI